MELINLGAIGREDEGWIEGLVRGSLRVSQCQRLERWAVGTVYPYA